MTSANHQKFPQGGKMVVVDLWFRGPFSSIEFSRLFFHVEEELWTTIPITCKWFDTVCSGEVRREADFSVSTKKLL